MTSTRHDIEHRAPEKWIKRAAEHLCASVGDANLEATSHAMSILKSALEDVTSDSFNAEMAKFRRDIHRPSPGTFPRGLR